MLFRSEGFRWRILDVVAVPAKFLKPTTYLSSSVFAKDDDEIGKPAPGLPQTLITGNTNSGVIAGGDIRGGVTLGNVGIGLEDRGPYRLVLDTVRVAPERAAAEVALGDSVPESVDEVGDVDDFFVSAAPGSDVVVQTGSPSSVARSTSARSSSARPSSRSRPVSSPRSSRSG